LLSVWPPNPHSINLTEVCNAIIAMIEKGKSSVDSQIEIGEEKT
jgi:hypothetical protein